MLSSLVESTDLLLACAPISKSVVCNRRFKAKLASHLTPLGVKLVSLFLSHVLVVIMAVHLVPQAFLDDLPALIIQHPLVAGLLHPRARVIIHLMPLNDLIAVADGPCHLVLILFLDGTASRVEFRRTHKGLLHKVPLAAWSSHGTHLHLGIHDPAHVLFHVLHHLIDPTESSVGEERIITERIPSTERHHCRY